MCACGGQVTSLISQFTSSVHSSSLMSLDAADSLKTTWQRLLWASAVPLCIWLLSIPCHIDFLSPFPTLLVLLILKVHHPACTRSLPSALYMHHPSKLMTSLKGLLQYKVCFLSNILSAFVLLPPPRSPKGSDLIYNILKWMGNYQAVLVQGQIKKLRQMERKQLPVINM